ncbi:MAG: carboxylating nicotinate-nucleotide diphosphorylase [Firmicutes bacterium]|nr:carboxylating nicotinate-nucleotide diphosphorylase [Bacillota bacterium]
MQQQAYKNIVAAALAEDVGFGDRTTASIFTAQEGEGFIVTREAGVVAGLQVAAEVFAQVNPEVHFQTELADGDSIEPGDKLAFLAGPLAGILTGERVALNFLQRLSGIATATRDAVERVAGSGATVTDTRKTTPGLRVLEKYAVRAGGGENHRFNLFDMVLIKDNHIRGAGSISAAVRRVKQRCGFTVKIEVEAGTLKEVQEALQCGVDVIMLDNMRTEEMSAAVHLINKKALVEASGGITREKLAAVASTGVDLISLGYLTYAAGALDFALQIGG